MKTDMKIEIDNKYKNLSICAIQVKIVFLMIIASIMK